MKEILEKITRKKETEARFLNTLSLLEFVGSRKISRTVGQKHPTRAILAHYADEVRHALAFKALSEELGARENDYLCGDEALAYFKSLDTALSNWLKEKSGSDDTYANYLLVTHVIEKRAMKIYPLYKSLTTHAAVSRELQAIIVEEASHLGEMDEKCGAMLAKCGAPFEEAVAIEDRLYQKFETSLEEAL